MVAIDEGRLKSIISELKGFGISLTDIEKEVNMRNKWGKMQNDALMPYTTEELASAVEKWMRF